MPSKEGMNSPSILLSQKKLLPFLRNTASFLSILGLFLFFQPREARAWCLFGLIGSTCQNNLTLIKETSAYQRPESVIGAGSTASVLNSMVYADTDLPIVAGNALLASANPAGFITDGPYSDDKFFVYEVQPGDTPGGIALSFGITVNTILWANDITNPRLIKPGDKLIIPPISGVSHEVKKGDTIESIAKKYGSSAFDIIAFNGFTDDEKLVPGETIIVPGGELKVPATSLQPRISTRHPAPTLELTGFFMNPLVNGRRSYPYIHGYNGVDLVNTEGTSCGKSIFASAEGTILIAKGSGWNGGYGNFVVILHPNGVQTLYAHMKKILVFAGKTVAQGENIGLIGSTGNSTGCHVHFEVRGAKNPF